MLKPVRRQRLDSPARRVPVERLRQLGYPSYDAYLRSQHWQDIKFRYRHSAQPQECEICGDPNYQLHHKTYARLGRELVRDFVPLCRTHHRALHQEYGWDDDPAGLDSTTKAFVYAHRDRGARP